MDTAPSAGGIQERAVWAADWVIIPTIPDSSSLEGVRSTVDMLVELKNRENWNGKLLGILPTIYEVRTRESKASMEELVKAYRKILLPPISQRTLIRDARSRGMTVFEYEPESISAKEYNQLAKILIGVSKNA
jgi:chromosome partitioning protein